MALVTVTSIEFSDGTRIPVPPSGTVVFVGPNNAGKSQALRDLRGQIASRSYQGVALTCSYSEVDPEQFELWAQQNLPKTRLNGVETYSAPNWGRMRPFELVNMWSQQRGQGLGMFLEISVMHADGSSRLSAGSSQMSFDVSNDTPTHPVQLAYMDANLEAAIDQACQSAFGLGISVDRWGGSFISLRVGDRPDFRHDRGVPDKEYLDALHGLPKLASNVHAKIDL